MKYSSFIGAVLASLFGIAQAGQDGQARYAAESDDRVACIEAAIADDVEEKDLFDKFVEACVQEKVAQRQKLKQDKG